MANIYQFDEGYAEGQRPYKEDIEVTSVVRVDVNSLHTANQFTDRLLAGAGGLKSKGPLRIDSDYDAEKGQLTFTLVGSISAVNRLVNYQDEADKRLFEDSQEVATVVQIEPIHRPFAISIVDQFLIAHENHAKHAASNPEHNVPLRIDTEYNETGLRLRLVFSGSVFAISYFLLGIYMRFTQRLERAPRTA